MQETLREPTTLMVESLAKQDRLFARREPGWIDFEDAQKARVSAIEARDTYAGSDGAKRLQLARDCLILAFLTCQPPDR